MSKYSSYKEHQLITENWRKFLNEDYRTAGGGAPSDPRTSAMVYTANRAANALRSRNLHQQVARDENLLSLLITQPDPEREIERDYPDTSQDDMYVYLSIHTTIQDLYDDLKDASKLGPGLAGRDEHEKRSGFWDHMFKDIRKQLASYAARDDEVLAKQAATQRARETWNR